MFESPKVKDWQLPALINDYCKERKLSVDRKAAEMLKDYIGLDLSRLFGEIDKTDCGWQRCAAHSRIDRGQYRHK